MKLLLIIALFQVPLVWGQQIVKTKGVRFIYSNAKEVGAKKGDIVELSDDMGEVIGYGQVKRIRKGKGMGILLDGELRKGLLIIKSDKKKKDIKVTVVDKAAEKKKKAKKKRKRRRGHFNRYSDIGLATTSLEYVATGQDKAETSFKGFTIRVDNYKSKTSNHYILFEYAVGSGDYFAHQGSNFFFTRQSEDQIMDIVYQYGYQVYRTKNLHLYPEIGLGVRVWDNAIKESSDPDKFHRYSYIPIGFGARYLMGKTFHLYFKFSYKKVVSGSVTYNFADTSFRSNDDVKHTVGGSGSLINLGMRYNVSKYSFGLDYSIKKWTMEKSDVVTATEDTPTVGTFTFTTFEAESEASISKIMLFMGWGF